jgi:hypothetical protein
LRLTIVTVAVMSLQQQIVHVIGEATSSNSATAASYSHAVAVILIRNVAESDTKDEEVLAATTQNNSTDELPCADALVVADWVAVSDNATDNEMQT